MTNELLFLLATIANFSMVLVFYRFLGKMGLFAWMAIATIIANIEVIKCVDMFGLAVALGNVVYGSTFLSTDILSEMYGSKEARRSVKTGFLALIAYTITIQVTLLFIPNEQDTVSGAMEAVFSFAPRICIVSIFCFLVSNLLDTYLYQYFKKKFKPMWVRNNLATCIAQFIDTVGFTFLAFWGIFDFRTMIEIIITAYIMKVIVAALDTPFLYIAKWMAKKYNIQ